MIFRIENLNFRYNLKGQNVVALRSLSHKVSRGDFQILTGPSGSGKTTLLNLLGLIEPLQDGQIFFDDIDYKSLSEREKNKIRGSKIGFVFQSFQLMPVLTAEENVEYFIHRAGLKAVDRRQRIKEALSSVGLWEHRQKRPGQMSGGQQQRVAIARALVKRPELILADEPTASLDQKTGRGIMELFRTLNSQSGVTMVASSHDPMVHSYGKQVVSLLDGALVDVKTVAL